MIRIFIILILLCMFIPTTTESFYATQLSGWFRNPQCQYGLTDVLNRFVQANHLNQTTTQNWSVYLPCGYNRAQQEFKMIKSISPDQKIYIISGHDTLSRKDTLWDNLWNKYGPTAKAIMPNTYLLNRPNDITRFQTEHRQHTQPPIYILKKNIQRQQGLKMTRDPDEVLAGAKDGFVVVQEMLQDPYLIDGRKTNCRVYLLIVCKGGQKRGYLYNNGYMYYTPKPFRPWSMEYDRVITAGLSTGRKDINFYRTHPLTMKEWQQHVDAPLFKRTGDLLTKVLDASSPNFCSTGRLRDRTTFQLFGCDIAFNNRLMPQLIEINKGPDLSSKTQEEQTIKDDLMANVFRTIGIPVRFPVAYGKFTEIWKAGKNES